MVILWDLRDSRDVRLCKFSDFWFMRLGKLTVGVQQLQSVLDTVVGFLPIGFLQNKSEKKINLNVSL